VLVLRVDLDILSLFPVAPASGPFSKSDDPRSPVCSKGLEGKIEMETVDQDRALVDDDDRRER
jgi:hypothetical protein